MPRFATLLLVLVLTACATQPQPRTPLSWDATAMRATAYFNQGQMLDALPLYEELSAHDPKNPVYAGRLAFCLLAKFETLPTGKERTALVARARSEAQRAQKLGDNSNLTKTVLEGTSSPAAVNNPRDARLQAAEELFVKGDMDGALAAYKEIAAADPESYSAHLFAGDVYFRKRDYKQAGEWFQKAIAIDPNIETAYRYWGDALIEAGDREAALQKFVGAIVAEPYNRSARMGLSQWAQRNASSVSAPQIRLPSAPKGKDGKTITVDAGMLEDPDTGAAWLIYSVTRSQWRGERFKQEFPAEKEYRHSLAEEVAAMRAALLVFGEKPTKDPSLSALAQLQSDGMLEAYVLLSIADDGITRDYDAYRTAHRDVLHNYLLKHVVKRNSSSH